jgi:hypothetical protein
VGSSLAAGGGGGGGGDRSGLKAWNSLVDKFFQVESVWLNGGDGRRGVSGWDERRSLAGGDE